MPAPHGTADRGPAAPTSAPISTTARAVRRRRWRRLALPVKWQWFLLFEAVVAAVVWAVF